MNELLQSLAQNIWAVYLDTAIWLLVGLIAAGLVKVYIPEDAMKKWLGARGFSAVGRAALFGAPLPLCSCGVLPAAIGLHRAGASKEATVSFLISTPETSIDSVARLNGASNGGVSACRSGGKRYRHRHDGGVCGSRRDKSKFVR